MPDDFHFVLKFMDDEHVEHELDLDHFQLVFRQSERRLSIGLTGQQIAEIRNLPSIKDRMMP